MEILSQARYQAREFVKKHPDVLWVVPLASSAVYAARSLSAKDKKAALLNFGISLSSLISTAYGLKLAHQVVELNKENAKPFEEMLPPELLKEVMDAIARAKS